MLGLAVSTQGRLGTDHTDIPVILHGGGQRYPKRILCAGGCFPGCARAVGSTQRLRGLHGKSVCCPVAPCRGMQACTRTLIHNYFLLNLQSFRRGVIPFGTVGPEHLLRFLIKWKQPGGELPVAVVKCCMGSRLEIQLAAKMLYWKHKATFIHQLVSMQCTELWDKSSSRTRQIYFCSFSLR